MADPGFTALRRAYILRESAGRKQMSDWYTTTDLARDLGTTPAGARRLLRRHGHSAGRGGRHRWPQAEYGHVLDTLRGRTTVDAEEVRAFSILADEWWDETGPFRMLHRLNPVRLSYLRAQFIAHFELDGDLARPLEGLKIVDAGCGGGLITDPLARLGGNMTGIDASAEAIAVARRHAERSGLVVDWREGTLEDLAARRPAFDAVVALEIVEHVTNREAFVNACVRCVRPGGLVIFSTLNRTLRSLVLAKIGAEYVLGWIPKGTHDFGKFVKPAELARDFRQAGARLTDVTGLSFHAVDNSWQLSRDCSINYAATAVRNNPAA